jgi:hypothetical protein
MSTGHRRILESEHVVGRDGPPRCALTIDDARVSGMHAELRWTGSAWQVKDLGSTNGTYLDGKRLQAGATAEVHDHSRIAFGRAECEWELVDAGPPAPMVVPLEGGEVVLLADHTVFLGSPDEPRATLYRDAEGTWTLERSDGIPVALAPGQIFEAEGRLFRLSCPKTLAWTVNAGSREPGAAAQITDVHLTFSVSREEEFVNLRASFGGAQLNLGESVYNFFLLTLARRRLADAAEGFPDMSCGWVDREELARDPTMPPSYINLAVHRLRDQFARTGVIEPSSIVERRTSTRQLRIGTARLTIIRL